MKRTTLSEKDKPVLLLSSGRSGSTLLQKLLNTHPELVIWGEHGGILTPLMNSLKIVGDCEWIPQDSPSGDWLLAEDRPVNPDKWTAWDGSFSKSKYEKSLRIFLDTIFADRVASGKRWGFKEIRYHDRSVVDGFVKLYPGSQIILLIRDPVASCVSFTTALNKNQSNDPGDYLENMDRMISSKIRPAFDFFSAMLAENDESFKAVFYERLTEDPTNCLDEIGDFLSLSDKFDNEKLSSIYSRDIVSERKRISKDLMSELSAIAAEKLSREADWFLNYHK